MLYFYNPEKDERASQSVAYNLYGVTPETATEKGWFPFSITQAAYDRLFYYPVDEGVEPDGQGGYKITWSLAERPADMVKKELKALVATKRYEVETAGILVNGSTILTDRESQATVTGAKTFADLNPSALVDWKSSTGWVQIDAATINALATAVGTHVQQCFSRERALCESIDAAADTAALIAIDTNAEWPETAPPAPTFDPMNPFMH